MESSVDCVEYHDWDLSTEYDVYCVNRIQRKERDAGCWLVYIVR